MTDHANESARTPEWGSDVVVEVLRQLGIEYAAVLPGSTFRGIHDSAVNYLDNTAPELILTAHENACVGIARGYARVTNRPMAVILHNVVGLLNGSMAIYDSWSDRVPVLVLGGAGPVDAAARRPWIDWIHMSNVQGNLVRPFTKWDDQPASVAAIPESLLRGYRIAVTPPTGPVYLAFDLTLQETALEPGFSLPNPAKYRPASAPAPDPDELDLLARSLVGAELPVILADRYARTAADFAGLVELAELLGAPVVDLGTRHNFPTPHRLEFNDSWATLREQADAILALEPVDLAGALGKTPVSASVMCVSLDEYLHRGQFADYQALPAVDVPVLGDAPVAVAGLIERCRALIDDAARERIARRETRVVALHAEQTAARAQRLQVGLQGDAITETVMAHELWQTIKDTDFFISYGRPNRQAPGTYNLLRHDQLLGGGGGGAVGIGPSVAVGAALALRGSGKVSVAIIGDGDMALGIQSLWSAAHYQLPTLWVVNNNRSYFNDEQHQYHVAVKRGRSTDNRVIAMHLKDPAFDFSAIAASFGFHAEGPVRRREDLGPALARAAAAVQAGKSALVDVWTERRAL